MIDDDPAVSRNSSALLGRDAGRFGEEGWTAENQHPVPVTRVGSCEVETAALIHKVRIPRPLAETFCL